MERTPRTTPATFWRSPAWRPCRLSGLPLEFVDESELQLDRVRHEVRGDQQLLVAMSEQARSALGVFEPRLQISDIVAQGADAPARERRGREMWRS
jgi:hypothetical protein